MGRPSRDVLLAVDVVDDFRHAGGDILLASFRDRAPAMSGALERARAASVPVVYANDNRGIWDGDRARLVREALVDGLGADVVRQLQPIDGDRFVVKPRYSAFDLTPLPLILETLEADRLVVVGATTEMCVAQTAIDARERDFMVSVLADACATVDRRSALIALEYLRTVSGTFVERVTEWEPAVR
jgi:nicotinamidase-related amidase